MDLKTASEMLDIIDARHRGEQISEMKLACIYLNELWPKFEKLISNGVPVSELSASLTVIAGVGRTIASKAIYQKAKREKKELSRETLKAQPERKPETLKPQKAQAPKVSPAAESGLAQKTGKGQDEGKGIHRIPLLPIPTDYAPDIKIGTGIHGVDPVPYFGKPDRQPVATVVKATAENKAETAEVSAAHESTAEKKPSPPKKTDDGLTVKERIKRLNEMRDARLKASGEEQKPETQKNVSTDPDFAPNIMIGIR